MKRFYNFISNLFKASIPMKEMENNEDINQTKDKIIKTLSDYAEQGKSIWQTPEEIASNTGTTVTTVTKIVESFDDFVENSKGQITTKRYYVEREKFIKQFNDFLNGRIK